MEEYKLLIVDDELLVREHMANILDWNRLGISQILEAANGYEAIELVKQHAPQIMILDIKMPEMDGMQLLEHIKVLDVEIQIIVSSGYSDFEAARRMLSMGQVVDYLLKPVGADMMFEAVCKCIANLEEKQQREELFKDLEGARNTLRKTRIRDLLFGLSMALSGYLQGVGDVTFTGGANIFSRFVRIALSYAWAAWLGNMIIAWAEIASWALLLALYGLRFFHLHRRDRLSNETASCILKDES